MSSYRAVLAGHAFKSVRLFWFIKLTILFIFLRHRNVFNKNFKRERWVESILLKSCSDFTFYLGLVYMEVFGCHVGEGKVLFCCFVNLSRLCIKPDFTGHLKSHVLRASLPVRLGDGEQKRSTVTRVS